MDCIRPYMALAADALKAPPGCCLCPRKNVGYVFEIKPEMVRTRTITDEFNPNQECAELSTLQFALTHP